MISEPHFCFQGVLSFNKLIIMKQSLFFIGFIVVLFLGFIGLGIWNDSKITELKGLKVIDLQQQQLISGNDKNVSTEIRYLVITDKETFVCESSMLNGKFDNSNLFFHLEKGKTYDFKVCGIGKGFLFDYRNILESKEIKIDAILETYKIK